MFDAFANCENLRVVGLHLVVHEKAAVVFESRSLRQTEIRADADGHDDHVRLNDAPVLQQDGFNLAVAADFLGVGPAENVDAARLQLPLKEVPGGAVQLPLHQVIHQVNDGDLDAAFLQARRRLQPQQPAADNNRLGVGTLSVFQHPVDVAEVAIGHNAIQIAARYGDDEGRRSGGDQQLVIRRLALFADDDLTHPVDGRDRLAKPAVDAVIAVPVRVMRDDFLIGLFARQHGRKHDAVIVAARLRPEKRDVVKLAIGLQQMLHRAARGHTGADDDKFHGHYATPLR